MRFTMGSGSGVYLTRYLIIACNCNGKCANLQGGCVARVVSRSSQAVYLSRLTVADFFPSLFVLFFTLHETWVNFSLINLPIGPRNVLELL